jgi:hypothetical protein
MDDEREQLIEAACTAWRPEDPRGGIRSHPAWHDLDDAARIEAFERTRTLRTLEAALDPGGLSTTAKAVLGRVFKGKTRPS